MVSEAMRKFVFLSLRFSGIFFRLKKGSFPLFFTVKQFFSKIKLLAGRIRPAERTEGVYDMKKIDVAAAALVIIGALNWGLAGTIHLDLVAALFGMKFGETSALSAVVYSLVGLAGLYQALTWKSIQRRWYSNAAGQRA